MKLVTWSLVLLLSGVAIALNKFLFNIESSDLIIAYGGGIGWCIRSIVFEIEGK